MARSARMFEIIQLLRSSRQPMTAAMIAETLEVTPRTIYRDVASLQAMRVPIDGAAGVGYIMRPGFDLPPINFDVEEAEAITVGLSLLARTGDKGLMRAAKRAAAKITDATPLSETLYASSWSPRSPATLDLSEIRNSIRREAKVQIEYEDELNHQTSRIILPIAVVYYTESAIIAAWCELRQDFRHFRPDRIKKLTPQSDRFTGQGPKLRKKWAELHASEL